LLQALLKALRIIDKICPEAKAKENITLKIQMPTMEQLEGMDNSFN